VFDGLSVLELEDVHDGCAALAGDAYPVDVGDDQVVLGDDRLDFWAQARVCVLEVAMKSLRPWMPSAVRGLCWM
jgi:hypothetical protein